MFAKSKFNLHFEVVQFYMYDSSSLHSNYSIRHFAFQMSRPLHPSIILGLGCIVLGLFCPALCTLLRFVDSAGPEVVGMSCMLYRLFLNFKLSSRA